MVEGRGDLPPGRTLISLSGYSGMLLASHRSLTLLTSLHMKP